MSRTYKMENKNKQYRRGMKCPQCDYKNTRATLERCGCGCNSKTAILCKTCHWSNF